MGKSENKADREKLFCFGSISSCLGATLGLWLLGKCDRPPAELGQYHSRVVGGDTGPSVSHTSHIFDSQAEREKFCCLLRILGYLETAMGPPWIADA